MIHCLCNNINTRDIDRASAEGATTPDGVQKACGSEFNCGACRASIALRLQELHPTVAPVLEDMPFMQAAE